MIHGYLATLRSVATWLPYDPWSLGVVTVPSQYCAAGGDAHELPDKAGKGALQCELVEGPLDPLSKV